MRAAELTGSVAVLQLVGMFLFLDFKLVEEFRLDTSMLLTFLAKVEDGSHAHPPSQDAQALLHTYESTIERLTEQVKTLNGEKISLSSRVAEMSSDLNMSKNRLDQSKVRENYWFLNMFCS